MRIIFMGTPGFAVESLAALIQNGENVAAVFTQPDKPRGRGRQVTYSPVKEMAIKHNLAVYQPTSLKSEQVYQQLMELQPDLIVVVAYGQILPKNILQLPQSGCINVHASLLPKYRGAAPIHWAIINGETVTGITTMFMTEKLDAGEIILKESVAIAPETTVGELHDKLALLGAKLLLKTIELFKQGEYPSLEQNEQEATYAQILDKSHELINWHKDAQAVANQIRGMNPWPGAYTLRKGERLKIYEAHVVPLVAEQAAPGQVVQIAEDGFIVKTGINAVKIMGVQPAGKKQMAAAEFLRGYQVKVGEILG